MAQDALYMQLPIWQQWASKGEGCALFSCPVCQYYHCMTLLVSPSDKWLQFSRVLVI